MEKATVSKLKDNLSAYLRKVRAGHPVVIYDRDLPIARIERIEEGGRGADRLALLKAQGLVRPPLRTFSAAKWRQRTMSSTTAKAPSGAAPSTARLGEALRDERESDR